MGHSEGEVKGKFCALRASNCGHAKYRKVCKPGWSAYFYYRGETRITKAKYNAHHILCVADVTGIILGAWGIQGIVKQTEWCINKKQNMIALPLWGHTLKHYMSLESGKIGAAPNITSRHKSSPGAPDFAGLPQHDSDHEAYQVEIRTDLQKVVDKIKKNKAKHEADPTLIATELNDLSDWYRDELTERGADRQGGTHKAWMSGRTNKSWYLPFSMAPDGKATKRTFPLSNSGDMAQKAMDMIKAFLNK